MEVQWIYNIALVSGVQQSGSIVSSVQLLSRVQLFATPWIAARQASLSIANSRSSLKLMSIESVMPPSHLILWHPLLLLPTIPPSIRVFSNESTLRMRWPKYWSFSFSIISSYYFKTLLQADWYPHLFNHVNRSFSEVCVFFTQVWGKYCRSDV